MSNVKPGIYPRGTIDYDAIDAVNFSSLKELAHSPKRYQHRKKHGRKATRSMERGTAAHTALLEPDRFFRDYAVFGLDKKRGSKEWSAFEAANPGKEILKLAEYEEAITVAAAVRADPIAMRYLENGMPEVALVWTDKETGTQCKGRVDWLDDIGRVIPDIKGARNIESHAFWRQGAALNYHTQAAFYASGYHAITGHEPTSKIIAVEFEPPHDVVVYNMTEEVLDKGREEYRRLLLKLIGCQDDNRWPGYANNCELDAQLPAWMMTDDDDLDGLDLDMGEAAAE
jgi:hypothetical protein